jgi:hypothetical protein
VVDGWLRIVKHCTFKYTLPLVLLVLLLLLPQLFSQDQLLLSAAASADLSPAMACQLLPQLLRVARREEVLRLQLWGAGEDCNIMCNNMSVTCHFGCHMLGCFVDLL